MRVLVAEESRSEGLSVCETVRSFGYEVDLADRAEHVWRCLRDARVPILVANWTMPGLGLEFFQRVRGADWPHYTYAIVMTAQGDLRHPIEALSAGADDFIAKPFEREELGVRLTVARRIVALESQLRQANEELRQKNERLNLDLRLDPLMGIGNRTAFNERVGQIHERAVAAGRSYGVVMCDLDHFKCYNDTFGHQVGDEVLQRVAQAVKVAVRATDMAFRYGGEELVLLLEEHTLESAAKVAERVRTHVEAMEFEVEGASAPFRVTVSCGVAAFPEGHASDWYEVVNLADQALYTAKSRGRNQTALMQAGAFVSVEPIHPVSADSRQAAIVLHRSEGVPA